MHRIQAQVKKIKLGRHNSAPKLSCALLLKPLLMPVYKPPSISTGRAVRIDISDPRFLSQTLVEEIFVASNPETQ
jgi:hypothetical protein